MTDEEIMEAAKAQLTDARSFLLASVGSDGQVKFAVLNGTATEASACVFQARAVVRALDSIAAAEALSAIGRQPK